MCTWINEGGRMKTFPIDHTTVARAVYIDPDDQVPHAIYDSGKDEERPMQLFSRWYGFYLTYPDCDIYSLKENR